MYHRTLRAHPISTSVLLFHSTRPFLSPVEKKWIAFQLLNALRDARSHKIAHGDVKSQNILVTSWNWVYLTDFASHKPTYLPLDDPSDFAFYFDTSGRRSCYIAPERFFASGARPDGASMPENTDRESKDSRVTEAMDVFSAGCVIAELFREGAPLFTLSQLFKYREGELNIDSLLASIEDVGVCVSPAWEDGVAYSLTYTHRFRISSKV